MHAKVESTEAGTERDPICHFINGEFVGSANGKMFETFNPVSGEAYAMVHEAGRDEVDAAVKAAKNALDGEWGQMPVQQRLDLLYKLADGINARFDDFLAAECLDTGKPYSLASHIDIPRGAANFKVFADTIKNVPTESFMMETPDGTVIVGHWSFALQHMDLNRRLIVCCS